MSQKRLLPGANIFSVESKEEWNLKEDPYITAAKRLEEAKKKSQPLRGTGKLALKVLEWALHDSEGEPTYTTQSVKEPSSQSDTISVKQTPVTEQVQQEQPRPAFPRLFLGSQLISPRTAQESQQVEKGSSTRIFPLLDQLLRRPEQVATDSSKKPTSPRKEEEVYVEAQSEQGGYLRRVVAVE